MALDEKRLQKAMEDAIFAGFKKNLPDIAYSAASDYWKKIAKAIAESAEVIVKEIKEADVEIGSGKIEVLPSTGKNVAPFKYKPK